MALQKILAIISGRTGEYAPAQTSSGVATAGQVIASNASGVLDPSFLPPGVAPDVQTMIASEALVAGALVNIFNNAGAPNAQKADNATPTKEAHGFVLSAVASGGTATVYPSGLNTAVTGLTPGPAYLGAAGAIASAGASTAGQIYQAVGVAVSPTALQFDYTPSILRA